MRYILVVAVMLMGITGFSQDKWRTLTLETSTGLNINGDLIITPSINLYYELENDFAITNWSGLRYAPNSYGWIASQTQLVKGIGKKHWKVGAGFMYGGGTNPIGYQSQDMFYIISVSKRFHL